MDNNENKLRQLCLNMVNLAEPQFDFAHQAFAKLIPAEVLKRINRIIITGCGDSFLAAAESKGAFDHYLHGIDCTMVAARAIDATRYLEIGDKECNTLVVAVSASGGPARIAEMLERGNKHGCVTVALTNNAESRAAKLAQYTYLTTVTPDSPGLGSYFASMISLIVMAAVIGEVKTGKDNNVSTVREKLLKYNADFYQDIDNIDSICHQLGEKWTSMRGFEIVADGPLFYTGEFVAAKYIEVSGEKCTVIDSENYCHVNGLMMPTGAFGTIVMGASDELNITRIAETTNKIVSKDLRQVLFVCDKEPSEVGVTESVTFCKIKLPEMAYRFLLPLYAFLPGSLAASYHAQFTGSIYFRGPAAFSDPTCFTVSTSAITII